MKGQAGHPVPVLTGTGWLLCENGSIEKIMKHDYRSRFRPKSFLASIIAWNIRYDMQLIFCNQLNTGTMIKEILFRDIKERIERGDFDGIGK